MSATLGLAIVLFIFTFGCMGYSRSDKRITRPADFTGFITRIQLSLESKGTDTVYAVSFADKLVHKCIIEVTSRTLVFRKQEDSFKSISPGQLLLQDQIQVWFKGKYKEVNPFQGEAKQIIVINHY